MNQDKKDALVFLIIAGLVLTVFVLLLTSHETKPGIIHCLVTHTTPKEVGIPFDGNKNQWENTSFRFHFIIPVPNNFKLKEYKSSHPQDYTVTYTISGDRFLESCSNKLPDPKIFPGGYTPGEEE